MNRTSVVDRGFKLRSTNQRLLAASLLSTHH